MCDAAAIIDGASTQDKPLTRGNYRTKANFNGETSVFVRNLPDHVTDEELYEVFQKFGSVLNC